MLLFCKVDMASPLMKLKTSGGWKIMRITQKYKEVLVWTEWATCCVVQKGL